MRREARAVYSPRGSLGGAAKYQVWPVIPANAGIQGVVGLFLCTSAPVAPPLGDNHERPRRGPLDSRFRGNDSLMPLSDFQRR